MREVHILHYTHMNVPWVLVLIHSLLIWFLL